MFNNRWGQSEGLPFPADTEMQLALAAGGLAEDLVAAFAGDGALGMREDDLQVHALVALHVHEVGVRRLNQPLQLVSALFHFRVRVQEIDFHFPLSFFF